jgi:hypothetical protein
MAVWLKEIAPSDALRHWFGHEPTRWEEFAARYRAELSANPAPLAELVHLCRAGPVTLLFAAHDAERNNAVVLRDVVREMINAQSGGPRQARRANACHGAREAGRERGRWTLPMIARHAGITDAGRVSHHFAHAIRDQACGAMGRAQFLRNRG